MKEELNDDLYGVAVTAVTHWCANCVESSRPCNRVAIYRFLGQPAMRTLWMDVALPIKAGDVETNPGPTTSHKRDWICDICMETTTIILPNSHFRLPMTKRDFFVQST